MCGRYTLFAEYADLVDRFQIGAAIEEDEYVYSYNIAPSHEVLSVINDGTQNRMGFLKWGLIPPFAKDEKIGYKTINARAETLADKPSFRNAFRKKRCLVLADSFYEWKRQAGGKTPMRIKLKTGEPFGMAGLWETWKSPTGKTIYSCTVITTEPNKLMSSIHDRMPVILKPEDEARWLDPSIHDPDDLHPFLKPFDETQMEAFEVSSEVNSPKNNGVHLIREIC
ncbi:SOS response-associated peptidase [Peribacillus frigoritolerans]|uniref:SOS response-associated peptidase n=1 Tax=Peribacillus frigoritolerans TaxID=450367 RepID=UPI00105A1414|nr:SOS response-associated peptidase [Peribacillus frigoritolerans]TDL80210.1 SOS response-associated peptidase [Peribacillus frigoritolerans]